MMLSIPVAPGGLPNKRAPQVAQKPRLMIPPLSPVTSWYFTSPVMLTRSLAITAVAIPGRDGIRRAFIADNPANTAAGKTLGHGLPPSEWDEICGIKGARAFDDVGRIVEL